jgi:hypothetical protein
MWEMRYRLGGTHRVPSNDGGEAFGFAARVRTGCDVVEACQATTVQPGIQETERVFALFYPAVNEIRDNRAYDLYDKDQLCPESERPREEKRGERTGVAQLVPVLISAFCLWMEMKSHPCAEMSG